MVFSGLCDDCSLKTVFAVWPQPQIFCKAFGLTSNDETPPLNRF